MSRLSFFCTTNQISLKFFQMSDIRQSAFKVKLTRDQVPNWSGIIQDRNLAAVFAPQGYLQTAQFPIVFNPLYQPFLVYRVDIKIMVEIQTSQFLRSIAQHFQQRRICRCDPPFRRHPVHAFQYILKQFAILAFTGPNHIFSPFFLSDVVNQDLYRRLTFILNSQRFDFNMNLPAVGQCHAN